MESFSGAMCLYIHHDSYRNGTIVTCLPKDLDGTPQIENEEHNRPVMHFLQATENDEEDKIPSNHLVNKQKHK